MDREELKLKLINELIDKGLSDDQILEIVEKHFPADVVAAPAPSFVLPQIYLNRLVKVVKKIKDIKVDKSGIKYHKGEIVTFDAKLTNTKFNDQMFFYETALENAKYSYTAIKNITHAEMEE